MSWTRNSSSVRIIAFQKPTFDTATLMSASIGRVLVTRERLGTNTFHDHGVTRELLGTRELHSTACIFNTHS